MLKNDLPKMDEWASISSASTRVTPFQLVMGFLKKGFILAASMHAWFLVFKLPRALYQVYETFRPNGYSISNKNLWAFSRVDAGFRSWYNKIARDYQSQGRFGYAWDDGLGMDLGTRIYNNKLTYYLLFRLGTKRMMALGYLIMVMVSALLIAWRFNLWIGLIVGLLAAGSPLIIFSYTHFGKPEVFWWGLTTLFVFIAFHNPGLFAGLFWSFLALVNLSVSVLISLVLGPSLLLYSISTNTFVGLALGVVLGIGKLGFRGIYMWRSGFLVSLTSEQSRLWKRRWLPKISEISIWLPFALSITFSSIKSNLLGVGILIMLVGIGLFWVNFRIIYLSDIQSFHLMYWSVGLAFSAISGSIYGLLFIILLAYSRPMEVGRLFVVNTLDNVNIWQKRWYKVQRLFQKYPALFPMQVPQPGPLMAFFNQIPDGSRILSESDGDPRVESSFRLFWQWTEEFLPQRQIDLANEMYTRLVEPELSDRYLSRFNAENMKAEEMDKVCEFLGISYVVVFTKKTLSELTKIGYEQVFQADLSLLEDFRSILQVPAVELFLLKTNNQAAVIDPDTIWDREGNKFTWVARANQVYTIRYRFHKKFKAFQRNTSIDIEPYRVSPDLPLTFMRVRPLYDGPITLQFRSSII